MATEPRHPIPLSALPNLQPTSTAPQANLPAPTATVVHPSSSAPSQQSLPTAQKFPFRLIKRLVSKAAAIIIFAITVPGIAVTVWTKQSLDISNKSLTLAQWTAKKDFWEFCQSQEAFSQECNSTLGTILEEPPLLKRLLGLRFGSKQWQAQIEDPSKRNYLRSFTCYALFAIAISIILFVLIRLLKIVHRGVTVPVSSITKQLSFLTIKVLWRIVSRGLTRAKYRGADTLNKHRCISFEHDCVLHALNNLPFADVASAISSSASRPRQHDGALKLRVSLSQDRQFVSRFAGMPADDKYMFNGPALLDSGADSSCISALPPREPNRPVYTSGAYFVTSQRGKFAISGLRDVVSTIMVRLRIACPRCNPPFKEVEFFVVGGDSIPENCILDVKTAYRLGLRNIHL